MLNLAKKQWKDLLINNAGFSFGFESTEPIDVQAKVTIGINYYGTKLVSSDLIPLIRPGGRVVNVCSERGTTLGVYDQRHIDKLKNAKDESEIKEFLDEFKRCAKDDTKKENGFPESAYRVSKAAEIALTMIQHQRHKDLIINACCPGFVATDLTKHRGYLTIQEGADTPVYLATHEGVPNGEFLYQLKVFV
uniref:Uncharacterized protein n=1 Tax=Panagrolaimus sp. JU765 TaxID=591449 RepID=A0AC34Q375_9BILA